MVKDLKMYVVGKDGLSTWLTGYSKMDYESRINADIVGKSEAHRLTRVQCKRYFRRDFWSLAPYLQPPNISFAFNPVSTDSPDDSVASRFSLNRPYNHCQWINNWICTGESAYRAHNRTSIRSIHWRTSLTVSETRRQRYTVHHRLHSCIQQSAASKQQPSHDQSSVRFQDLVVDWQ